jgi:two-component system response regulator FixJ
MAGAFDLLPADPAGPGAADPGAVERDLQATRVLCVEDDPVVRRLLEAMLRPRVGPLVLAGDGASGLAAFRARPAGIVVTDLRMPGQDGLAMVRAIRALDPAVPVVVLTEAADVASLTRAIDAGVDQYVLKPVQEERLVLALQACVYRRRAVPEPAPALSAGERERLARLSPREREILAGLGRGLPSRAIAQALGIQAKTVQAHQANLMRKLALHKATALAAFAVRAGLR